jgi:hypothetical protein
LGGVLEMLHRTTARRADLIDDIAE